MDKTLCLILNTSIEGGFNWSRNVDLFRVSTVAGETLIGEAKRLYRKMIMSGLNTEDSRSGEFARAVPVNSDGRRAITNLIAWHRETYAVSTL